MQRIAVLLNDNDHALFDEYCKEQGHKKSTLIAKLIHDFLDREEVFDETRFLESSKSGESRARRVS